MTVKVTIDLDREFIVAADINTVFDLLSNVPASAAHFPKVHALTPIDDNSFRWDLEKVALGIYSIQTSYACQYISDSNAKTIVWIPIKGEGNATVSGKWELIELATGTHIKFKTKAQLTLPFPGFLKLAISPLVKLEFSGMVDTYLRNLKTLWG
nr:SRPBCC family protein [uncultured Glaciecola sp.]